MHTVPRALRLRPPATLDRAIVLARGRIAALALLSLLASVGPAAAQPAAPTDAASRVLVIGTKEAPPFAMKAADGSWSGISINLWRRIASDLHLQYRFEETTLHGLIDGAASQSLDAAVAALTVTAERERRVDFTQPFYTAGLGIAVPNAAFAWWQFLRSFLSLGFLGALVALVGITLATGSLVWFVERRRTEHFQGGMRTGLMSGVWWSALTLTQAAARTRGRRPRSGAP